MTGVNLAKDLERNEGMFEMDEVLTINGNPLSEYDRLARLEEETFSHDAASIVRFILDLNHLMGFPTNTFSYQHLCKGRLHLL
jgi:hypothetical protein